MKHTYTPPANPNPNATKVYALWSTGCYYPGRVACKTGPNTWRVYFDDRDSCEVSLDNMRLAKLREEDIVALACDLVRVCRIDDDGTITVTQTGKAKEFPIPEEQIHAHWDDRRIQDGSSLIFLETPIGSCENAP